MNIEKDKILITNQAFSATLKRIVKTVEINKIKISIPIR